MTDVTTYSYLNVAATVDGLPVVGLADDDEAVSIERASPEGDWDIGSDGNGVWSQHVDNSAEVIIKLQHTSPTHKQLLIKLAQQKAGSIRPFPVAFIDTSNAEGSFAGNCLVMQAPKHGFGKNATTREWTLKSATSGGV